MLFGALVGKPQIRQHFPLLVKQFICIRRTVFIDYPAFRFIYWNGVGLTRLCGFGRFFCRNSLGQLVALSLLRELGPVVTALLFAGRAGSALRLKLA